MHSTTPFKASGNYKINRFEMSKFNHPDRFIGKAEEEFFPACPDFGLD